MTKRSDQVEFFSFLAVVSATVSLVYAVINLVI